jgi:hypothetical protein
VADHGDWGSKPIVSEDDWRRGTEYGGVGGIIAPLDSPHTASLTAAEQLMMVHNVDPMDAEAVLIEVPKKMQ